MTTRVVHLRSKEWAQTPPEQRVRIDRQSEWGNPFRLRGAAGGRATVIQAYQAHLRNSRPDLAHRARTELKDKVLGCWCAPKACHGDVLAMIAEGGDP